MQKLLYFSALWEGLPAKTVCAPAFERKPQPGAERRLHPRNPASLPGSAISCQLSCPQEGAQGQASGLLTSSSNHWVSLPASEASPEPTPVSLPLFWCLQSSSWEFLPVPPFLGGRGAVLTASGPFYEVAGRRGHSSWTPRYRAVPPLVDKGRWAASRCDHDRTAPGSDQVVNSSACSQASTGAGQGPAKPGGLIRSRGQGEPPEFWAPAVPGIQAPDTDRSSFLSPH